MPTPESAAWPLLLDTHIWIWLVDGAVSQFSTSCLRALGKATREGRALVSVISVWEVATLEAKQRITLSTECRDWIETALAAPGIRLAEMTPSIAIDSTRLPGTFHGDPADRILVATARALHAMLVTRDEAIVAYGRQGYVRVLDAGR